MKFEWEEIHRNVHIDYKDFVERAKVVGGWLIRSITEMSENEDGEWIGTSQSMVFIPDPHREWKIDES